MLALAAIALAITSVTPPDPSPTRAVPQEIDQAVDAEAQPHVITVEALCGAGERYLDEGGRASLAQSRRLFEGAVRDFPDKACGHAGLSRVLATTYLRRIEEDDALITRALDSARRAVELDASSGVARAALAGALLLNLEPRDAETAAEEGLRLAPDAIPALQAAALVRLARGRHDDARSAIDRALALRPDLPALHHMLGNLELAIGHPLEAIDAYRVALALSPEFLPSMFQLAVAFQETGNYPVSTAILRRLLADHPEESARVNLFLGRALMQSKGWPEALAVLDKADFKTRRGLSNGTVLYLKGICYEQLGRSDDARAYFRRVIDEYPEATAGFAAPERLLFPAYEGLGRLYLQARDAEKAVTVLEEAVAQPDASLDLFIRLSRLYEDYHLEEKAMALLERAASAELSPKTAGVHLSAYVLWARMARSRGDRATLDKLVASLDARAIAIARFADYVYDLEAVRAYSIAGRGDKALDALRQAVKHGYGHFAWMAGDPELESLRKARGFEDVARQPGPPPPPTD